MLTEKEFNDWITALKSGHYEQTTGQLYNPKENAYCCLGVLCEVSDRVDVDEVAGYMPSDLIASDIQDILVFKNDNLKEFFKEIADWIEENKQLFVITA